MAWEVGGAGFTTGPYAPFPARRGENQIAMTFRVGTSSPGTVFQVYGVVRHGGTVYRTMSVAVTVMDR